MLYNKCPMCGSKFAIEKVVSWPLTCGTEQDTPVYLAGVDKNGEVCCSYHDYEYDTREAADWAVSISPPKCWRIWTRKSKSEALACTDEHGYFMDYDNYDSYDYYD